MFDINVLKALDLEMTRIFCTILPVTPFHQQRYSINFEFLVHFVNFCANFILVPYLHSKIHC